jgi:hypothetical protein
MVLTVTLIWFGFTATTPEYESKTRDAEDKTCLGFFIFLSIISFMLALRKLKTALMILLAPRLYLIEYISTLINKGQ